MGSKLGFLSAPKGGSAGGAGGGTSRVTSDVVGNKRARGEEEEETSRVTTDEQGIEELIQLMARMQLQLTREFAQVRANAATTYLMEEGGRVWTAMSSATREHAEFIRDLTKEERAAEWPPHVWALLEMMKLADEIAREEEAKGSQSKVDKAVLKKFWETQDGVAEETKGMDREAQGMHLAEHITQIKKVRGWRTRDRTQIWKAEIAIKADLIRGRENPLPLHFALSCKIFEQRGLWRRKIGVAPKSGNERELQRMVTERGWDVGGRASTS